jgi:hypothetical protein
MMNSVWSFIAPFAKVERAKTQIQDLEMAIKAFFEVTPYEIVRQLDFNADEEIRGFRLSKEVSADLSVRVGELFHNLRSSLDQMVAEIVVRIAGRSESRVEFPFGRDFGEFDASILKQKKLPADVVTMIRSLQPYNGGDPLLWLLHSANRRDKHRMGLIPIQGRQQKHLSYLALWYGCALVIGSRSGQHLTNTNRFSNQDYLRLAGLGRPWGAYGTLAINIITGDPLHLPAGPIITSDEGVFRDIEKGMEFLTATPGTKFKTDFQPTFDIALRDVGGLEAEPIVHVLSNLRDLVERILLTFERRFFP